MSSGHACMHACMGLAARRSSDAAAAAAPHVHARTGEGGGEPDLRKEEALARQLERRRPCLEVADARAAGVGEAHDRGERVKAEGRHAYACCKQGRRSRRPDSPTGARAVWQIQAQGSPGLRPSSANQPRGAKWARVVSAWRHARVDCREDPETRLGLAEPHAPLVVHQIPAAVGLLEVVRQPQRVREHLREGRGEEDVAGDVAEPLALGAAPRHAAARRHLHRRQRVVRLVAVAVAVAIAALGTPTAALTAALTTALTAAAAARLRRASWGGGASHQLGVHPIHQACVLGLHQVALRHALARYGQRPRRHHRDAAAEDA